VCRRREVLHLFLSNRPPIRRDLLSPICLVSLGAVSSSLRHQHDATAYVYASSHRLLYRVIGGGATNGATCDGACGGRRPERG
jgi:hypothetical protein